MKRCTARAGGYGRRVKQCRQDRHKSFCFVVNVILISPPSDSKVLSTTTWRRNHETRPKPAPIARAEVTALTAMVARCAHRDPLEAHFRRTLAPRLRPRRHAGRVRSGPLPQTPPAETMILGMNWNRFWFPGSCGGEGANRTFGPHEFCTIPAPIAGI